MKNIFVAGLLSIFQMIIGEVLEFSFIWDSFVKQSNMRIELKGVSQETAKQVNLFDTPLYYQHRLVQVEGA